MIRVILVQPEGEYNVGFVARLCKNFGVKELYIVNPVCDVTKGREFAVRGIDVLNESRVVQTLDEAITDLDLKIATSSIADIPGDFLRKSVKPWEITKLILNKRVGLIFGRESVGLTREEISKCDLLLHIPTNTEYPVLNLSHAVGIVLYEINRNAIQNSAKISDEALRLLDKYIREVVDTIKKNPQDERIYYSLKRTILRGIGDEEDARTIIRFLRKIYLRINGDI